MDVLAGLLVPAVFMALLTVIPCALFILFAWCLRTTFEGDKTEDRARPGIRSERPRPQKARRGQARAEAPRAAPDQPEKQERYAREVEYAAGLRKRRLEVEDRRKNLARVQGGPPGRILVAELELAEKESELEYYQRSSDMSEEKRLECRSRLAALREQIKKEKKAWWSVFGR